ncbi:MAG TPA: hypothetical protein VGD99_21795 [Anaerolineae bacterium]|jgi:hypothetical protein
MRQKLLATLFFSLALLGLLLPVQWNAAAAPEAVRVVASTLNTSAITEETNFGGSRWSALGVDTPPTVAEVYLLIDIDDSAVNTTTFTLQVSPDGTNWLNHSSASALATAIDVDTDTYTRTTVEGTHFRVVAAPTNNESLTPTIKVILR